MSDSNPSFYSDVPISIPVVYPSEEDSDMNGFVWSRKFGILVKMNQSGDPMENILQTLKQNSKYLNRKEIN